MWIYVHSHLSRAISTAVNVIFPLNKICVNFALFSCSQLDCAHCHVVYHVNSCDIIINFNGRNVIVNLLELKSLSYTEITIKLAIISLVCFEIKVKSSLHFFTVVISSPCNNNESLWNICLSVCFLSICLAHVCAMFVQCLSNVCPIIVYRSICPMQQKGTPPIEKDAQVHGIVIIFLWATKMYREQKKTMWTRTLRDVGPTGCVSWELD